MTRRLPLVALALLALAAPAGARAAAWTRPAGFDTGLNPRSGGEPVPRAGVAADGTSAVAWMTQPRGLVVSTGDARGRFTTPEVIVGSRAADWSVAAAPGGAALVAWEDRAGAIRAAVRSRAGRPFVVRRVAAATGSPINGLQVAADPRGGWVVAERQYPRRGSALPYSVRALSLDADGRALGAPQDLGLGYFGIDARPTAALAVDGAGRAVLAFRRESGSPNEIARAVVVSTRRHGGRFTTPVEIPAGGLLADPRVAVGAGGRAIVAVARSERCGDAGCFGAPALSALAPDGTLGALTGPTLAHPGRAFAPTGAYAGTRAVVVFELKDAPAAFSPEAPVRAVAFGAGGQPGAVQTLSRAPATEPVALGLAGGRALAVWAGHRGWGAALAGPDGSFRTTPAPVGPPPEPFHFNSTNRDIRAAGHWAIVAWSRAGRVRISVGRF